jgi:hypothetical protein
VNDGAAMKKFILRTSLGIATAIGACGANADSAQLSTGNTKEITKLSPIALKVLDKDCPDLVQPYKLSDNFLSIINFEAKDAASRVANTIGGIFTGKSATAPTTEGMSDSARLAAKQLNWLPMEAEELYGQREHEKETDILDRESKLGKKYYPTADAILQKLSAAITETHNYNFKIFILKHSSRNAVARPGGYLYLDQGLVDNAQQNRKAYFALAHEIAHVLQRHETKELQSMAIDSFTAKEDMLTTLPKIKTNPELLMDHVKIGKDIYTQHHIDQELQADSCAARLLSRAYPDQNELSGILNAFLKDLPPPSDEPLPPPPRTPSEKLVAATHEIVSTPMDRHPNSKERTDNLNAMYREITAPPK